MMDVEKAKQLAERVFSDVTPPGVDEVAEALLDALTCVVDLKKSVAMWKRSDGLHKDDADKFKVKVGNLEALVNALELAHGHGPLDEEPVKCKASG